MKPCVRSLGSLIQVGSKERIPSVVMRRYFREHVGPLPDGLHVHHKCENPWCIEPTHLEAIDPERHRSLHGQRRRVVLPLSFDGNYA